MSNMWKSNCILRVLNLLCLYKLVSNGILIIWPSTVRLTIPSEMVPREIKQIWQTLWILSQCKYFLFSTEYCSGINVRRNGVWCSECIFRERRLPEEIVEYARRTKRLVEESELRNGGRDGECLED